LSTNFAKANNVRLGIHENKVLKCISGCTFTNNELFQVEIAFDGVVTVWSCDQVGYGCGLPYVTINPADVFNPLVKFLAGAEIDVDNLLPEQVPNFHEQSLLVAHNPAVCAKFFNIYMKAFISTVLRYDSKSINPDGGILGVVKGY
jgi:hypothetical protein